MANQASGRRTLVGEHATAGQNMNAFTLINLAWTLVLIAASARLYFLARKLETHQRNARKVLKWIESEQRKQRQL